MQGTDQWHIDRLGKVTCSRVSDVMAKTKSGPSASRKNYMAELVAERLTGAWEEGFISGPMKWGTETEPLARAEYEIRTGQMVEQVGFIDSLKIKMFGGSPDGLVGKDGGIETKCPNTATHIETLLSGKVDRKYQIQVQSLMAVTGRAWWDFVSYDPRLPAGLSYWQTRIMRDERFISEIEDEVGVFLAELDALEKQLRGLMAPVEKQSIF